MDLREKRELNRGLAETLSKAFEIAVSLGVFGLAGWWIDGRAGTRPVFMIVLVVLCSIGQFVRMWAAYDAEMRRHEAEHPGRTAAAPAPRREAVTR